MVAIRDVASRPVGAAFNAINAINAMHYKTAQTLSNDEKADGTADSRSNEPCCMGNNNHTKKDHLLVCVFIVLLFTAKAVCGETSDLYFESGVRAAQKQQYRVALKAFLQAKKTGLDSPELEYNLGVVYYKLADYEEAAKSFRQLVNNNEYAAVACYNLGLIELKLANEIAAKDWFLKAYESSRDPNLKNLSWRALRRLNVIPPSTDSILRGWRGFVSSNAGYDDNVSLIDEDVSQTKGLEDYHLEVMASTNRMMWGTTDNGLDFSANIDVLKQRKEHDYDYSQWHLGLAHLGVFSRWETRARVSFDQSRYGDADFQRLLSLDLRGQRDLSARSAIELRYRYVDIEDQSPDGTYEYLAGNLQQLRFRLTDRLKTISFTYAYILQLNDRNDYSVSYVSGGNTISAVRSYSPIRHSLVISADVPWGKSLSVGLEAQYRYSEYKDADTVTTLNGSTGATTVDYSLKREDDRYQVNVGLVYRFAENLQFFSDYSYTSNDSNRNGSDYNRRFIRAGVTWFY